MRYREGDFGARTLFPHDTQEAPGMARPLPHADQADGTGIAELVLRYADAVVPNGHDHPSFL